MLTVSRTTWRCGTISAPPEYLLVLLRPRLGERVRLGAPDDDLDASDACGDLEAEALAFGGGDGGGVPTMISQALIPNVAWILSQLNHKISKNKKSRGKNDEHERFCAA
jgi:hypothetical protein